MNVREWAGQLANAGLSVFLNNHATIARGHIGAIRRENPGATRRQLALLLVEHHKKLATSVGAATGVFGAVAIPGDLLAMTYFQLTLLADIATLHGVNLQSPRAREELLEVFGYANGISPLSRASPKVFGAVVGALLRKIGLRSLGKALPMVAIPVSAYLNHSHIESVGNDAIRHYSHLAMSSDATGDEAMDSSPPPPSEKS